LLIKAIKLAEFGSIGAVEMSKFHQLSLGKPISEVVDGDVSYASTSVSRLQPSMVAVMNIRIAVVVSGESVNCRQTCRLPITAAPGTSSHWVPVQYCNWNAVMP
jgi:hypothetical protein